MNKPLMKKLLLSVAIALGTVIAAICILWTLNILDPAGHDPIEEVRIFNGTAE